MPPDKIPVRSDSFPLSSLGYIQRNMNPIIGNTTDIKMQNGVLKPLSGVSVEVSSYSPSQKIFNMYLAIMAIV